MPQNNQGKLVYLMGASGAGKDSLLRAIRPLADENAPTLRPLLIVQRYITRPASAFQHDEQHHPCTEQEFLAAMAQGDFVMHWQSHDLYYGISQEVEAGLVRDAVVVVNGSRAYLPQAVERYPDLIPLLVKVDPQVLRARLEARGRESSDAIEERVQRASLEIAPIKNLHIIDNSEALDSALQAFVQFITQLRTL